MLGVQETLSLQGRMSHPEEEGREQKDDEEINMERGQKKKAFKAT